MIFGAMKLYRKQGIQVLQQAIVEKLISSIGDGGR
jgi:hypothetical protein